MTTTKDGRVFAYIAATCFAICVLVELILNLSFLTDKGFIAEKVYLIFSWVIYLAIAASLFIRNEKTLLVSVFALLIYGMIWLTRALDDLSYMHSPQSDELVMLWPARAINQTFFTLAIVTLIVLLLLKLTRNGIAGRIWYVPGVLMVISALFYRAVAIYVCKDSFMVTGFKTSTLTSFFPDFGVFVLAYDALTTIGFFLIGMWVKKRMDSSVSGDDASTLDPQVAPESSVPTGAIEDKDSGDQPS